MRNSLLTLAIAFSTTSVSAQDGAAHVAPSAGPIAYPLPSHTYAAPAMSQVPAAPAWSALSEMLIPQPASGPSVVYPAQFPVTPSTLTYYPSPVSYASQFVASPSTTKKRIKVYSVGDLVGFQADENNNASEKDATRVRNFANDSHAALQRLVELVEKLVVESAPDAAVSAHPETLSLVVRHSDEGHLEVEQLLDGLRVANTPTVEVEFKRLFAIEPDPASVAPEVLRNIEKLVYQHSLNPEEVQLLLQASPGPQPTTHVQLVPGRKTNWDIGTLNGQITAVATSDNEALRLRIDCDMDDGKDSGGVRPQTFSVPFGRSFVYHKHIDGTSLWLVTPKKLNVTVKDSSEPLTAEKPTAERNLLH